MILAGTQRSVSSMAFNYVYRSSNSLERERFGGMPREQFLNGMNGIKFGASYFNPDVMVLNSGFMRALVKHRNYYGGNIYNTVHSGIVSTMMDQICGFCAWSMFDDSSYFVNTVDLNMHFRRPIPTEDLVIDATCVYFGAKYITVEGKCYAFRNDENYDIKEAYASATVCFNVYKMKSKSTEDMIP